MKRVPKTAVSLFKTGQASHLLFFLEPYHQQKSPIQQIIGIQIIFPMGPNVLKVLAIK